MLTAAWRSTAWNLQGRFRRIGESLVPYKNGIFFVRPDCGIRHSWLHRVGGIDAACADDWSMAYAGSRRHGTWAADLRDTGSNGRGSGRELFPLVVCGSDSSLVWTESAPGRFQGIGWAGSRLRLPGAKPLSLLRILRQYARRRFVGILPEPQFANLATSWNWHRLGNGDFIRRALCGVARRACKVLPANTPIAQPVGSRGREVS